MSIRIFTPVWGDKHINLLEKALCPSLKWPNNYDAVKDANWLITTQSQSDLARIQKIIKNAFPEATVGALICDALMMPGVDSGMVLIKTLEHAIKDCLNDHKPMLMATPDFIYGNGTIPAFMQIASEPGTCATIAHLRAVPHMLGEMTYVPTNTQLMSMAWRHAHTSFVNSNADKKPGMIYHGGVRWWEVKPSLRAVQHYMPSPFFYNFTPKDLEHFREYHEGKPPGFGLIDHVWPTHLLEEGRLRFIASSEIAMMVEMTDPHMNVPPWNKLTDPPGFFRNHFHNKIQSQVISSFRGEEVD